MKLPLFALLLLSSCAFFTDNLFGSFPNANQFLNRFPENQKALIMIKNYTEDLFWCKVESQYHEIKSDDFCIKVRPSKLNQILMLDPGIYKLIDYSFTKEQYIFGKTRKNLSSKSSLVVTVDANKINYVGLIERVGSKYKAEDEFAEIQKSFKTKNYQELKASFEISLNDIDYLFKIYEKNSNILKYNIAEVAEYKIKTTNNKKMVSCVPVCDKDFILRIEQDLNLNKEKYNQKYIKKLEQNLSLEKQKCAQNFSQKSNLENLGEEDE